MRRRTALATAVLGPLTFLASASAWAPWPAWAADTWNLRQLSADERRRLLAGETLPFPVAERTDRDLAAGVVLYLPLPVARVGEHLVEAHLAVRDPGVSAWGLLPERANPEDLAKLRLGPAETAEILEARFPVRLVRFALRRGSGGAGLRRGGDGLVREIEALTRLDCSILSERRARAPFGLEGGAPGSPGRNFHGTRELPGRATFVLEPGERVRIETPGGGGWGHRS